MHSFCQRLPGVFMIFVLAACGSEQKPTAADAKVPEKTAAPAAADKPPVADAKVKVIEGGNPADQSYDLKIEPPTDGKAGQEGTVMVRVIPKKPWHMNLDYPTSLAISAPSGVKLAKGEQNKADAIKLNEESAEFGVKFTADKAGDQAFTGKFKFAVCQDDLCSPVTEELKFQVAVK